MNGISFFFKMGKEIRILGRKRVKLGRKDDISRLLVVLNRDFKENYHIMQL